MTFRPLHNLFAAAARLHADDRPGQPARGPGGEEQLTWFAGHLLDHMAAAELNIGSGGAPPSGSGGWADGLVEDHIAWNYFTIYLGAREYPKEDWLSRSYRPTVLSKAGDLPPNRRQSAQQGTRSLGARWTVSSARAGRPHGSMATFRSAMTRFRVAGSPLPTRPELRRPSAYFQPATPRRLARWPSVG